MGRAIDIQALREHLLYHVRYGRGAVIIAAEKQQYPSGLGGVGSDWDLARNYHGRNGRFGSSLELEPVLSIEELDGYVRVVVKPAFGPFEGTFERTIQRSNVRAKALSMTGGPHSPGGSTRQAGWSDAHLRVNSLK